MTAEKTPFDAWYGDTQGRVLHSIEPTDGAYTYVLGDELARIHEFELGDYVEIHQDIQFSAVKVLRADLTMLQPADVPLRQNIAGHYVGDSWVYSATLKRGEVMSYDYPSVTTLAIEPFHTVADSHLLVSINEGANQDINVPVAPATGYTAVQIAAIINGQLIGGQALVTGTASESTVTLRSLTQGLAGSIEVVSYPGPLPDANIKLNFYQKASAPTAIYGGDDLSAIIVPDVTLTEAYLGLPVELINCMVSGNSGWNALHAIVNDHTAVLRNQLVSGETVGFDAWIPALSWLFSIWIDSKLCYQTELWPGANLATKDVAVNVSKLTGMHSVMFKLELPYGRVVPADAMVVTEDVLTALS